MGEKTISKLFLSLCLYNFISLTWSLSCIDESNSNVDWFINYKLPKLENKGSSSFLSRGEAYAFITSRSTSSKWILSQKKISSTSSMLAQTLKPFYGNNKSLSYLFYNDEPPEGNGGSSYGHTKGVVMFDDKSGFWLIHSIPKFPAESKYEYPSNAFENGQSIFCVSFSVDMLNDIGHQLIYNHPNIFLKHATADVLEKLDDDVQTLFSDKPKQITKGQLYRITDLTSVNNVKFKSFAKDNQFKEDLYSELIAPELQTSLLTETWRRGSGSFSPPFCKRPYTVNDVKSINMTASSGRNSESIHFQSTEDHSKWAISTNADSNWVCIGDINRMDSQKKRGGGSLCFSSRAVWQKFRSVVGEIDKC